MSTPEKLAFLPNIDDGLIVRVRRVAMEAELKPRMDVSMMSTHSSSIHATLSSRGCAAFLSHISSTHYAHALEPRLAATSRVMPRLVATSRLMPRLVATSRVMPRLVALQGFLQHARCNAVLCCNARVARLVAHAARITCTMTSKS
jgi:hypothetical protein